MGVKRIHMQLASKRRWQSEFIENVERDVGGQLQYDTQQKRWTAQPTQYSRYKDLP